MTTYPKLLVSLMDKLKVNQGGLAQRLGVSQGTVSRWVKGGKIESENRDRIDELAAEILKRPLKRPLSVGIAIVGYAGAGDDGVNFGEGQGPFGEIRAPDWATDKTVAVHVRGTSLGALLDGWYALYDDRRDPPDHSLAGKLCIVGLPDKSVYVKKLARGSAPRKWHLISNSQPPIFDVEVEWAAEIRGFAPPWDFLG